MEGRWDGVHLQGQAELGWGGMYEGHRVGRCGVGNGRHWELGRGWEKIPVGLPRLGSPGSCIPHLVFSILFLGPCSCFPLYFFALFIALF